METYAFENLSGTFFAEHTGNDGIMDVWELHTLLISPESMEQRADNFRIPIRVVECRRCQDSLDLSGEQR